MNGVVTRLLSGSRAYRNYSNIFRELTGFPLVLRPIEPKTTAGSTREKWSCATLGQLSCGCKYCSKGFARLVAADTRRDPMMRCGCGCCGAVMPIRSGNNIVALLQIGLAKDAGNAPVGPKDRKYRAVIKLARIFSEQLSGLCNQMLVQKQRGEPPIILRTKDFITEHFSEDISSRQVAKELHLSRFYFCKLFKSSTGLTFTAYLARVRIEHVKELLRNPNLRISEIAFQSGFQSLTHFNRLFAKLTGESPTEYRKRLRAI